MSVLAAFDFSRPFTRFDVWTVLFWVNVGIVVGLAVVMLRSVLRDDRRKTPANLDPFLSDDELEGPHLERVLGWALFFFAIFAVTLPLYWLHEASRGKGSEKYFQENAVKRGEELYSNASMPHFNSATSLQCANCHGTNGGGGSAPYTYTDPVTGVAHTVAWKAPALNTVLYRFSPDEVNEIITLGRPGSPMQSWGLDRKGSGPKNAQSINDLVSYIVSIQLPPGTTEEAAADLANCTKPEPSAAKTALGQAACEQAAWKTQPETQLAAAQKTYDDAVAARDADEEKFSTLGCRASYEDDSTAAETIEDADAKAEALKAAEDCKELRRKVRDMPDPATPVARNAVAAAEAHLSALEKADAPKDELEAAQAELKSAKETLAADEAAFGDKNCRDDGTAPLERDDAACARLLRSLEQTTARATDDLAVDAAKAALDWAQEWKDRRAGVTDGQILFETNCARCHTKNWSIFDPTNVNLKPEALLGEPGGGGSLGFNLRDDQTLRRFADKRGPDSEIVLDSGTLEHVKFVIEGSVFSKAYGLGGRGSGMMPGQCNDAVQSDPSAPKLKYYGCMLSSASTPKLAPTTLVSDDADGGIDDAMIEQIVLFERCGLDASTSKLEAATYSKNCK